VIRGGGIDASTAGVIQVRRGDAENRTVAKKVVDAELAGSVEQGLLQTGTWDWSAL